MPLSTTKQVEDLRDTIYAKCSAHKAKYLDQIVRETESLMVWLGFLRGSVSAKFADRLLDSVQGSVIEVGGCISLGLVRPALLSIRTQLELMLAWIYFNDHPIEWREFERTGEDYPMRKVLVKYMGDNDDRFQERWRILSNRRKRKNEDPYRILSAHVHGISLASAPSVGPLSALVQPDGRCDECVDMQSEVGEYLTDILASWYARKWHDFPPPIAQAIRSRLSAAELKAFSR